MSRTVSSLRDVVDWGLCTGCGACYAACTKGAVSLVNLESTGIRPKLDAQCSECNTCLTICPGYNIDGNLVIGPAKKSEADHEFGPTLEIWEGYASDSEIRYGGSSGGILTALALYCLEHEHMESVLHVGMNPEAPWANHTVLSRNRTDLLSRTGSRYAPSSPCEKIGAIESSASPCVFIGKPCDTAAVEMMRRERPELDRKLGLVLTFFCAGVPSTNGTLALINSLGSTTEQVNSVRYRGEGWPGRFKVLSEGGIHERSYSYEESWGRLTAYRPLRCNLCPDGLGRLADISCGDAWERYSKDGDPGRSIVLVRTERGRQILERARKANYVTLEPVTQTEVLSAQKNLLQRRRELFGRLLGMKLLLVPIPRFRGFSLLHSWGQLPVSGKIRSVLGTARRLVKRGLYKRQRLFDGNEFPPKQ
jgi:coenzyme F420 hydrogenase subunit beta